MPINMLPQILKYFRAEKEWSLYILLIAAVLIVICASLWWSGCVFRGAAIPLIEIAMIEVIACSTVYLGTDAQIDTLTGQYYSDRETFAREETARMESVMSGFRIYKIIEIALIVIGVVLILVYRSRPMVMSAGAGLTLQAGVLLAFDLIASQRAQVYLEALRRA